MIMQLNDRWTLVRENANLPCQVPFSVYDTLVKGRGKKNAVSAMCDEFFRRYQGRRVRLAIVHGNVPEEAVQLEKKFREHLNVAASIISPVSPVLAIHTGLGLLGAIVQYAEE